MNRRHWTRPLDPRTGLARLAAVACLVAAGCQGATAPDPSASMTGVWTLVGYSDHGVVAEAIGGTMSFDGDGTFRMEGTIRYPGEAEAPLTSSGTWTHDVASSRLSLTTSDGTGVWDMTWMADTLALTLTNDPETPPATELRIRR